MTLAALVVICLWKDVLQATDCNPTNAHSVIRVPGEFYTAQACAEAGYNFAMGLQDQITEDAYMRLGCAEIKGQRV